MEGCVFVCVFRAGNDSGLIACGSQNKDHSGFPAPQAPCLLWTEVQENGKAGVVRDTAPQLPFPPEEEGGLFSQLSPRAVGH